MPSPKAPPSTVSPAAVGNQGMLLRPTQYASTSGLGRGAVIAGAAPATPPPPAPERTVTMSSRYGSGRATFSATPPAGDANLRQQIAALHKKLGPQPAPRPAAAPSAPAPQTAAAPAAVPPARVPIAPAPAFRLPPQFRGAGGVGPSWDRVMRIIGPPQVARDGRIVHPSIYDQLNGAAPQPRAGVAGLFARLFNRRKTAAAQPAAPKPPAAPAAPTTTLASLASPKPAAAPNSGMPQRLGQSHNQAATTPPLHTPAATNRAFNSGLPHPRAPLRHFADANPNIAQSLYFDPSYNPASQPSKIAGMPAEWFSPDKLPMGLNYLGSWLQSSVTPQWKPETGGTSPFGTGVGSSINPMFEYGARQADTALRRYQDFAPAGTQASEALDALRAFMADVQQQGGEQVAPLFAPEGAAQ